MLEMALLDQLEQLNARYPRLNLLNIRHTVTQMSAVVAATLSYSISVAASRRPTYARDMSKIYFPAGGFDTSYKALSFDLVTEQIAYEDTVGRYFSQIITDASNAVWASANQSGYYGLWKRTAFATWTNVLTDSATGNIYYLADGTPYFKSSTGNWYTLANGAATLTAAPANVYLYGSGGPQANTTLLDFPSSMATDAQWPYTFTNIDGSVALNYPYEFVLNAGKLDASKTVTQIRIDATYSLVVQVVSVSKVSLYILNRSVLICRYIGDVPYPALPVGGGTVTTGSMYPFFAKMANGQLNLYWGGKLGEPQAGNTAYSGVLRQDVSYTPDF